MDVDQVRQAAKDAAIYGFPSVIQYRTMWLQVLDANSASYVGFGRWLVCGLPGPEDKASHLARGPLLHQPVGRHERHRDRERLRIVRWL